MARTFDAKASLKYIIAQALPQALFAYKAAGWNCKIAKGKDAQSKPAGRRGIKTNQ